MKKLELFLDSHFYPISVTILAFIAWVAEGPFQYVNYGIVVLFLIMAAIIMAYFKDTSYAIPLFLGLMFMVNIEKLGLKDIQKFSVIYILVGLIIIALVIHLIRFKPKLKFGFLLPGFLLLAISYMIPLYYVTYSTTLFVISMVGFIYLAIYVFIGSTAQNKTDKLLTYFFYASIIILAQLIFVEIQGYLSYSNDLTYIEKIRQGISTSWGSGDFGYGNINDLIIFFTLTAAGQLYMIIKHARKYFLWIFPFLSVIAVIFSGSRGGYIAWALLLLLFFVLLVTFGSKKLVISGFIVIGAVITFLLVVPELLPTLYDVFIQGGFDSLDLFSSSRITLYKDAWAVFLENPLFGGGWMSNPDMGNPDRIQIYHSTIFHTLAISGLFGMFALIFYIFSILVLMVKKMRLNVAILGSAWLVTMIHGLIDNTVHMIIYTLLTILIFTSIEQEENTVNNEEPLNINQIDYLTE